MERLLSALEVLNKAASMAALTREGHMEVLRAYQTLNQALRTAEEEDKAPAPSPEQPKENRKEKKA